MGLVLENKFVQDLQLRILQEFFKVQMHRAFDDEWTRKLAEKAEEKYNSPFRVSYVGLHDTLHRYGIENLNETSADVTALYALMYYDFRDVCGVGQDFCMYLGKIKDDRNLLIGHLSNTSTTAVNKLIYQALDNLKYFLQYLRNTQWDYPKKTEFATKYLEEIAELVGEKRQEVLAEKLRKLPFFKLQEMISEEYSNPEAELEMYLRLENGNIKVEEYEEERKESLLRKAVDAGYAEAKAVKALRTLENPFAPSFLKNKAIALLDEAMNDGSAYAYYAYGINAEVGLSDEPNYPQAYKYYAKAEKGCIDAEVKKAYFMALGIGVETDVAMGKGRLTNLAYKKKCGAAFLYLGYFFLETDQDTLAFETFRDGDRKTHDNRVAYQLSLCYLYGIGTEKNEDEALKLLERLDKKGFADGKVMLGKHYYRHGTENDYATAFNLFKQAEEKGNVEAKYMLGRCYFTGRGIEKDLTKAFEDYISVAANQGHSRAINMKGRCYFEGKGTKQNKTEAFACFSKVADELPSAKYWLGRCYYEGVGVKKDEVAAFNCFKSATEEGNDDATYYLGECYYYGYGTEKNKDEAIKYFKKVENEYGKAAYLLSGLVSGDEAERITYLEKAVSLGHDHSAYVLGNIYHNKSEFAQAFEKYKDAANLGNTDAEYMLGVYNLLGYAESEAEGLLGISLCDMDADNTVYKKAVAHFMRIEKKDPYAKMALAYCNYYGVGCDKNKKNALRYFSALYSEFDRMDYDILYMLGLCCFDFAKEQKGKEKSQELQKYAYARFKDAIDLGNTEANYMLGLCYYFGFGTKADKNKALGCFKALSECGVPSADSYIGLQQKRFGGGPSQDPIKKVREIAKVPETLYGKNEFMYGVCLQERCMPDAEKHYQNALLKGDIQATAMLEIRKKKKGGVSEGSIKIITELATKGVDAAKCELISYLYTTGLLEELETLALEHKWFDEITEKYINHIALPLNPFTITRQSIEHRYSKAIQWMQKAKAAGYLKAEKQMAKAKDVYDNAYATLEKFGLL